MRSILAFALATILATGTVWAAPPLSVANRTWILDINGTAEELFIDTQAGAGAPGNANCRRITGTLRGNPEFVGWYCPSTGRIHFVHQNIGSGFPVRTFTGTVSDEVTDQPLFMAGTATVNLANSNLPFGDLGEYVFSAREQ